jgi:hypothetical protein
MSKEFRALAKRMTEHCTKVASEEKAESVARQMAADGEEPPSTQTFTLDEVLRMFRNLGHDTECGACMGTAFTGHTFSGHSCGKQE